MVTGGTATAPLGSGGAGAGGESAGWRRVYCWVKRRSGRSGGNPGGGLRGGDGDAAPGDREAARSAGGTYSRIAPPVLDAGEPSVAARGAGEEPARVPGERSAGGT